MEDERRHLEKMVEKLQKEVGPFASTPHHRANYLVGINIPSWKFMAARYLHTSKCCLVPFPVDGNMLGNATNLTAFGFLSQMYQVLNLLPALSQLSPDYPLMLVINSGE